jgi:hypothetical protein
VAVTVAITAIDAVIRALLRSFIELHTRPFGQKRRGDTPVAE